MQQVLVKVPVFNPLHTEEARKLNLLPIQKVVQRVNTVEHDADEQILEQFSGGTWVGDETRWLSSSRRPKFFKDSIVWRSSYSFTFKKRRYCNRLASRIVNSQKSGKSMLRLSGVKLKLNSNSSFKVSRTSLLSNRILLVGRRLLKYFPPFGNFYDTVKR